MIKEEKTNNVSHGMCYKMCIFLIPLLTKIYYITKLGKKKILESFEVLIHADFLHDNLIYKFSIL